jgi:FKBP-type peptidyl-prolyl cis-trans isomerase 2
MVLREGDFIQLEYTGMIKETGDVFDTTDMALAKKEGIYQEGASFGPVTVCLGQNFMLSGVEKALIGKELGQHTIGLEPEQAFGKKSAKLVQLMPTAKLRKENIEPQPGLQLNVDGMMGVIKTVSGGRTIVDFNHPLAGKELTYKVKALKLVSDEKEKADACINFLFKMPAETELKEGTYTIKVKARLPKEAEDMVMGKLKELTGVKKVIFKQ